MKLCLRACSASSVVPLARVVPPTPPNAIMGDSTCREAWGGKGGGGIIRCIGGATHRANAIADRIAARAMAILRAQTTRVTIATRRRAAVQAAVIEPHAARRGVWEGKAGR